MGRTIPVDSTAEERIELMEKLWDRLDPALAAPISLPSPPSWIVAKQKQMQSATPGSSGRTRSHTRGRSPHPLR
jgi:hypothetical protein